MCWSLLTEPKWEPSVVVPIVECLSSYGHYHNFHPESKCVGCAVLYSAQFRYVHFALRVENHFPLSLCILIDLEGY